jgi:hypothetical protein
MRAFHGLEKVMVPRALDCLIPSNRFMSLTLGYENTLVVAEEVERLGGLYIRAFRDELELPTEVSVTYLIFLYKVGFGGT